MTSGRIERCLADLPAAGLLSMLQIVALALRVAPVARHTDYMHARNRARITMHGGRCA